MKTKRWSKKILEVKGRKIGTNGKVKVTCAFCDGEGVTKTNVYPHKRTCPSCKGARQLILSKPVICCVFCNGSGRERKDPKVTCLVCRGSGVNQVRKRYKICEDCRGSGQTSESRLPCVSCKGAGVT